MYELYAIMEILEINQDGIIVANYNKVFKKEKKANKLCDKLQSKENISFEVNSKTLPKYSVVRIA